MNNANAAGREKLWVYQRGALGDIEVWANHIEQVIDALKAHGFVNIDVSKIKQR